MPFYKSGKFMMMIACYKSDNNDYKSDNNEDKVCLLLTRWGLVGHVFDYMLDHMLDHMLNLMLNHRLDHIIISFITITLQKSFFLAGAPINK